MLAEIATASTPCRCPSNDIQPAGGAMIDLNVPVSCWGLFELSFFGDEEARGLEAL